MLLAVTKTCVVFQSAYARLTISEAFLNILGTTSVGDCLITGYHLTLDPPLILGYPVWHVSHHLSSFRLGEDVAQMGCLEELPMEDVALPRNMFLELKETWEMPNLNNPQFNHHFSWLETATCFWKNGSFEKVAHCFLSCVDDISMSWTLRICMTWCERANDTYSLDLKQFTKISIWLKYHWVDGNYWNGCCEFDTFPDVSVYSLLIDQTWKPQKPSHDF